MDLSPPVVAGSISSIVFAASVMPMLTKAVRTRDLSSYSPGNLLLANVGNLVHSVYIFSLPAGPIWALHSFYLITTGFMLAMYLRHRKPTPPEGQDHDHPAAHRTDHRPELHPPDTPEASAPDVAAAATDFAGRCVGIMNQAAIALLTSVGHQTGLFELLAAHPGATSHRLAEAGGLQERYVREWLGGMVTAGFVRYDPADGSHVLPPEHAAVLTPAAGPDNMAQKSAAVNDASLIDGILPLVTGLPERLGAGIEVADVGCGSGHAVNLMAAANPPSRSTGRDFSAAAIATARQEATAWGLTNIHRALRPGGVFLMVDIRAESRVEDNIDLPWASYLYAMSMFHCMSVSLGLGGDGLGTVWGRQVAQRMVLEAGFGSVEARGIETDPFNTYYVALRD